MVIDALLALWGLVSTVMIAFWHFVIVNSWYEVFHPQHGLWNQLVMLGFSIGMLGIAYSIVSQLVRSIVRNIKQRLPHVEQQ